MRKPIQKQGCRKGFSLVELLIAIVVLGIISGLLINSGVKAQEKARISAATTALSDFVGAFSTTCIQHPGIMNDRLESWGADGTSYNTKKALERTVAYMNENLDSQFMFTWSDTDKCYVSLRQDPWGGNFCLYKYPFTDESATGAAPNTDADPTMRLSIWATGNDDKILTDKIIGERSVGVAVYFQSGNVDIRYNNVDGKAPFTGNKLINWDGVVTPGP